MTFTTRPELKGTFGMVSSTHWLASAVGMKLLEAGGTAADAAAGMGMVLCVVEPHLNGPLGDMPALVWPAGQEGPSVICGQGTAPAGATIAHYRSEGIDMIPGSGLLATVIPGAFDAWMVILRDHGRLPLADVMAPAIHYAEAGHPALQLLCNNIAHSAQFFRDEWPTSAATWLPGDAVPKADALFANPELAAFWRRLVDEAAAASGGREAQIEAARRAFYKGFVAEAIDDYLRAACVMDGTGERRGGVLTADDMAGWEATYEDAISVSSNGWQVFKAGPWTQGPALLQAMRILEHTDLAATGPRDADFVHLITEALKLAMADREAYYGDPAHSEIPLPTLLSDGYARDRAALIGAEASQELRPGRIAGFESQVEAFQKRAAVKVTAGGFGAGEPTMAHLTNKDGDTVHIDVVDRWGNMVSATPSGGWLQSSPVIPGLGVPLNSRAQMFWLEEGRPTSLAPGRRPRTTLTPSVARARDGTRLSFGTPGGDQQDQWQLILLARLMHHGLNLQEAIDGPLFHTGHLQGSFYPHVVRLGYLMAEPSLGPDVIGALRAKGHDVDVSAPWSVGRLTAVSRDPSGLMRGAATPRLMQAYAMGR